MVFGLFSKEKSLQKTIDRATNKLAQQVDRMGALDKLREDSTEEALFGLCKRFGITSMKGVEDEHEKNWVVDVLVEKATLLPPLDKAMTPEAVAEAKRKQQVQHDAVLAAVTRYMKSAEQLAFPLRVLERIVDHDRAIVIIDALLAGEPPGYVRMPERRIDLLRWLSEWKPATDAEVVSRLTPYLADFDENVRFAAIDGMAGHDPTMIVDPLIDALIRPDEESGRIRRTIVEILARTKAPLGERADAVAKMLTGPLQDEFRVEGGLVKQR